MKVKYSLIKIVAQVFLFVWSSSIFGSDNIRFFNISPEKIPEIGYVLCMHKDSDGYMWFGTYNGLIKYNGSDFKIFSYSESGNSLSNSVVQVITEDHKGNLWLGTEDGLNKFDKQSNTFINYTKKGNDSCSLSSTHVRTLYFENDSVLWVGMRGGGLSRFNIMSEKFTHYRASKASNTLTSDDINCFFPLNDSVYYIGTENGGLVEFNKNTHNFKSFLSLAGTTISNIHVDTYNNIWVGIWDNGLYKKGLNDTVFNRVPILDKEIWTPKDIKEDSDGDFWIGTFGQGLIKYNPIKQSIIQFLPNEQSKKSIAHSRLWSVLIDDSQFVWIGSFGNGVSVYDKYSNKFLFEKTNIENPKSNIGTITSVAESKNGNIWMLANKKLFEYNLQTKEFKPWILPTNFNEKISKVFCDKQGYLWLGCDGSMVQLDIVTSKFRVYMVQEFAPQRKDYVVNYIEQDNDNNIWFSIYEGGLYKIPVSQIGLNKSKSLKLDTYIYYKDSVVIPSNIIWQIKSTANGNIWIATNTGFCKLDKNNNKFESFSALAHSSLYSKHPGIIWLGSLGKGLGKFEISTNKLTYFKTEDGLSSDIVFGVHGDMDGNLWLITQKGISKFNPINESFKNYDETDGIEDVRFSMNSGLELSSGEMLFYSNTGFTIFKADKIKDNPNTPKVAISDVKLYNRSITFEFADSLNRKLHKPLSEIERIEISHEDKMLTINFNALFYSSPDHVEYAYRLQGFDQEWNYTTAQQRNATYTNLSGGEYLFKVKASNADGVWSDKTCNLVIEVIPPIWQKLYFKIIAISLIGLLIFVLVNIQYGKIKKRYAFEEIKREREITRLKIDKLDSELEKKNNELISKTLVLLHKNEKIKELKNIANDVLDKVSKTSQPLVYSLLRFIQSEFENDQFWDQFEHQFNLTHNNFIDRFKEKYPRINHKDLKVCAYVRMDLTNQEMANLLNVTLRGIEASRHRIRKKIKLDRLIALNDYIRNF